MTPSAHRAMHAAYGYGSKGAQVIKEASKRRPKEQAVHAPLRVVYRVQDEMQAISMAMQVMHMHVCVRMWHTRALVWPNQDNGVHPAKIASEVPAATSLRPQLY
jgi:hypothetical protein